MTTFDTVTDQQIHALRAEADIDGDSESMSVTAAYECGYNRGLAGCTTFNPPPSVKSQATFDAFNIGVDDGWRDVSLNARKHYSPPNVAV